MQCQFLLTLHLNKLYKPKISISSLLLIYNILLRNCFVLVTYFWLLTTVLA